MAIWVIYWTVSLDTSGQSYVIYWPPSFYWQYVRSLLPFRASNPLFLPLSPKRSPSRILLAVWQPLTIGLSTFAVNPSLAQALTVKNVLFLFMAIILSLFSFLFLFSFFFFTRSSNQYGFCFPVGKCIRIVISSSLFLQ